jgi:pSer/pThr/pTyr-binding forkhead associated (FHA) protein
MSDPNDRSTSQLNPFKAKTAPLRDFDTGKIVPWVVEFRVVGTPYLVRAPMERVFTIGRSDADRNYVPEIDLTEYEGQSRGVSRKHAKLTAKDNRVMIQDLGSANGTFLNNQRLEPLLDYRLNHGDVLKLGQLELQVNFVVKPYEDDKTRIGGEDMLKIPNLARGESLLIVEENEDVAKALGYASRQAGFNVTAVVSVQDAITEISQSCPQGIITELIFTEGHGTDLIRYVRSVKDGEKCIIVALTTATAGFNMGKALNEGSDIFIAKPIAMEELVNTLSRVASMIKDRA